MHWENIQKRAKKRSNVIFADRQGFVRFFAFDAFRGVLSAFLSHPGANTIPMVNGSSRNAQMSF